MYGDEKVGYYGLKVRELLDDSMAIVNGITKTGHFYYIDKPKFKVINKKDWAFGKTVYGIYEGDIYVWTEDCLGGKRLYKKEDNEPTDILGEIFMELDLGSKWKGQFFTPMTVCKAMADMTIADTKNLEKIIKEKGHFTVLEPACGGGALIIALAVEIKKEGFNYQECMKVTAVDLDLKAVCMCYIQLSLLGIPAIVVHGNSLTQETFSTWKTPMYLSLIHI